MTGATISYHLKILKNADLIFERREKNFIYYQLNTSVLEEILLLASLVTILPVVIGILFWNRLPDMMATHFGFDNEANGFSSKPFAVFGIPLFCLVLQKCRRPRILDRGSSEGESDRIPF